MENIVNIEKIRETRTKSNEKRILDARASFTVMAQCLKTIEMNNMPELRNIKAMMRKTMHQLREIGKDERR